MVKKWLKNGKTVYLELKNYSNSVCYPLKVFIETSPIIRSIRGTTNKLLGPKKNYKLNFYDYQKEFLSPKYDSKHYTRIYLSRKNLEDSVFLDNFYTNLRTIVTNVVSQDSINYDENSLRDMRKVITELVDNVLNHTINAEVILQFSIEKKNRKQNGEREYIFLNLAFLNFSENMIYDDMDFLMNKILNDKKNTGFTEIKDLEIKAKYNNILEYYDIQKQLFDEIYNKEHFLIYSAFQNNITNREMCYGMKNGGTGLAKILSNFNKYVKDD